MKDLLPFTFSPDCTIGTAQAVIAAPGAGSRIELFRLKAQKQGSTGSVKIKFQWGAGPSSFSFHNLLGPIGEGRDLDESFSAGSTVGPDNTALNVIVLDPGAGNAHDIVITGWYRPRVGN